MTHRSPAHLAYVRTLPCAWCRWPAPSEASHHGAHGTATKASDYSAIPLCGPHLALGRVEPGCHAHYHRTGTLPGSSMDGAQVADWAAARARDVCALRLWLLVDSGET